MIIYVVKENDTVDLIAKEYNIPAERIIFDNQLVWPYELAMLCGLRMQEAYMPNLS